MDPAFHNIYQEQVEFYRRTQSGRNPFDALSLKRPIQNLRLLSIVSDSIESGISVLGGKFVLRPDARLFLTINLHQMVLLPIAHTDSPRNIDSDLEQGLRRDVRMILEHAAEITNDRSDITASRILRATSEILDRLTLKSWQLWDES